MIAPCPLFICPTHFTAPTRDIKPFARSDYLLSASLKAQELNSSGLSGLPGSFCHRLQWEPCSLYPYSIWIGSFGCIEPRSYNRLSSFINNSNYRSPYIVGGKQKYSICKLQDNTHSSAVEQAGQKKQLRK